MTYWSGLHVSARRNALSKFQMPAMSPTMTEGGIASWKFKEGDSFSSGDVLLEIVRPFFCATSHAFSPENASIATPLLTPYSTQETDKATIDVEAQDDGVLAKIIVRDFRISCHI